MIETPRLLIRPFRAEDLERIHAILERAFGDSSQSLEERRSWLAWSALSQEWLPKMHQPPYGDQAVVLKSTQEIVGAAGLVPLLDVYEQVPGLSDSPQNRFTTPEMGLFWAVDPDFQGRGYATAAARALVNFAFRELRLKRLLATTETANAASQAVMRKLGMTLHSNPYPQPAWLQVVGLLNNPAV
jgi:[ribosomal protein S5]-alanine N-acetyltransferase